MEGLRGRSRELSTLTDAFRAACVGQAGAVLVGGDAGVGKTKLVSELVRQARRADAVVLTGSAIDIADAPPFWPVLSALRTAVRSRPDDDVGALLTKWLERLPSARGDGPPVRLLDLLHQTITELAELRPVLLVVEDLHWADRSTRDLVAYLVAILTYEPVLVVATFRNDTPGASPDLVVALAELRRHQKVTALELAPLPRDVPRRARGGVGAGPVGPGGAGLAALGGQRVHRRGDGARGARRRRPRPAAHPARGRAEPHRGALGRRAAGGAGHRGRRGAAAAPAARRRARAARGHAVGGAAGSGGARRRRGRRERRGLPAAARADDRGGGGRPAAGRTPRPAPAVRAGAGRFRAGRAARPPLVRGGRRRAGPRSLGGGGVGVRGRARLHRGAPPLAAGGRAGGRPAARRVPGPRRPGRPSSRATTTRPCGCSTSSSAAPGPTGWRSRCCTPARAAALRAAGRVTEAAQSYEVAAALLPASGAEAERAQVLAAHSAALLQSLEFAGARTVALRASALARAAGARTVEARVLSVLGFSLAYLEDADRGRRRPRRGRGRGGGHRRAGGHHRGPRAPGRAARRAAEPARRGHRLRPHGPGADARAGPGPHRGRRPAHLRRQRAVPDRASGPRPRARSPRRGTCGRPARPRWTCGWPAAASTSPGATSTPPRPTWRPSSCWPGRPPARGSASRCWCCSPRSRCGAAAPRWRWRTSRTGSPWSRRARTTSWPWPRWCGTRRGRGPTW